jgi:uncharacterized protein YbjT (DUF2867 family)
MILVTGASGKTGLAVVKALSKRKLLVRAMVHKPEQQATLKAMGAADAVIADLEDAAAVRKALAGISACYLIVPNVHPREFQIGQQFVSLALAAGVERIVYHSVLFPQIEAMPHHWQKLRVEEMLAQTGLDFTILQPASYMQNILPYWEDIQKTGRYSVPYNVDKQFSPVDLADVAEAAARVLAERGHSGLVYQLCGPELLSSNDMALQISAAIRKTVRAEEQPLAEWEAAMRANGMRGYSLETLSKMFDYYNHHGFAASSTTLTHLLGQSPNSFADFLHRIQK